MPVGHPPHLPTKTTRAQVESLAAFGINHEDISKEVGISIDTLRACYHRELDCAANRALGKVAQNVYEFACGLKGNDKAQLSAGIFWLKTRGGWRETTKIEHSGDDRKAIQIIMSGPDKFI